MHHVGHRVPDEWLAEAAVIVLLATGTLLDGRLTRQMEASGAAPIGIAVVVAVTTLLTAWGVVDAVRKVRRAR